MKNFTVIDRTNQFYDIMDVCMPHLIIEEFINYLDDNNFFEAPASLKYHGAYSGGLFDHSFTMTKCLLSLTKRLELKWSREESPYIVGMFHDLCKVDNYKIVGKPGSRISDIKSWNHNDSPLLTGHGEKSVIILQQYIKLTEEEIMCIRWHMGAFDDKENWVAYGRAVNKYPNVLYTHTADMMAAHIFKV
ncbi:MAG: hypothetical protein LUD81_04835 [Clostridiales bacterium]|nr:hypothetical protein [Clostridiales bacterium]